MAEILKSAGVIIRNKKLLVCRTKGKSAFVSPGGKIELGETALQTLVRELQEELNIKVISNGLSHFGSYTAEATYNPGDVTKMEAFMVNKWEGEVIPSHEIEEIKWINTSDLGTIELGSIFEHEVMPRLKEQGLIS